MDVANSAVTTLTTVFSSFWSFVLSNPIITVIMLSGLVGTAISLFLTIKSRLTRKR